MSGGEDSEFGEFEEISCVFMGMHTLHLSDLFQVQIFGSFVSQSFHVSLEFAELANRRLSVNELLAVLYLALHLSQGEFVGSL